MKYLKGHNIKPDRILQTGKVVFTNGTNDCNANEPTCIAYGYKWNAQTKTCEAFRSDQQITVMKTTLTVGNKNEGVRNEIKEGSFYNDVNGSDNIIGRQVQNSNVTGKGNEINDNLHNVSVSGSYAKIQRQGEIALGGGNYGEAVTLNGYAQSSTIHCIARTGGSGTFIAGVGGVSGAPIPVQSHSVIIFDILGTVIKEAGGDNWQFNQRIVATMDNNNMAAYCNVSSSIDCGPAPEGWTYPALLQLGDEETGFGDIQVNVYGLPELELTYNLKIDLLETRTINTF